MNLDAFVVTFALLIGLVFGDDPQATCTEEKVDLYYVGANSTVYYLPKGDFTRKHKLDIGDFKPFALSYNYALKSLLFLDHSYTNRIYEYHLESQTLSDYYLGWEQEARVKSNTPLRGKYIKELQIASDPLTGNFFFIHENNGIYVCDMVKNICAQVLEPTKEKRRNLILHPKYGKMLWIEGSYVKVGQVDGQEEIVELTKPWKIDSIGLNAENNLFYVYAAGVVMTFSIRPVKQIKQTSLPGEYSIFYGDCKIFSINNATGFLNAHYLNGQNETIEKREPNTTLIMDSEPLSETLMLENPCKDHVCDNGVCVITRPTREGTATCLTDIAFKINKMKVTTTTQNPITTTTPATITTALPITDHSTSGWAYFFIFVGALLLTTIIFVAVKFGLCQKLGEKFRGTSNNGQAKYEPSASFTRSTGSSALSSVDDELHFKFRY